MSVLLHFNPRHRYKFKRVYRECLNVYLHVCISHTHTQKPYVPDSGNKINFKNDLIIPVMREESFIILQNLIIIITFNICLTDSV